MFAKQLTVFIENRTGRLSEVLNVLKENNVNILSLSLADTTEFGLLRLIVDNAPLGKEKLLENGVSDESIGIIADEMARISRIGEGSEEKLDQMILEIAQLRDDTISAITEEYPDLNVEKDMDLLLEYLEIRRLRLSYKGYDGIEDMPDNDMGGPDNDDYGQPGEDDDGSLEQPGDLNNKKSIFDIIAAIFERIINWFRELFRS